MRRAGAFRRYVIAGPTCFECVWRLATENTGSPWWDRTPPY